MEFKEFTKRKHDKISSVWNFFLRTEDGVHAQCKKCKKVLKCQNTTTCLHNHLKRHHDDGITVPQIQQVQPNKFQYNEPEKKKVRIDEYFHTSPDNMETMVSKMTACDGLPFNIFCTSESIRSLFQKSGYKNLPMSPNTIKKIVVTKSDELKSDLKKDLTNLKAKGQKFSITLDEWTSARNRRYMNVNIHCQNFDDKNFRNLGLARIVGRGTTDNCIKMLQSKLAYYDLSLDEDIACVVTDGASVMCALGRKLPSFHQQCLAHGIQCAVLDVIYREDYPEVIETEETQKSAEESSDSDSDTEEDLGFIPQHGNQNRVLRPSPMFKDLIKKVRNVVKVFRNSPTKTEILNNYLLGENRQMGLILDCKTRWNSMADMITRFLQLKDAVMKALIDLKVETKFSPDELALLEDLSTSLNIVKATVEVICQEKANLLTAETALQFMVAKLQETNTYISGRLLKALKDRIAQRRQAELIAALKYLQNPKKYYEEPISDIFWNPDNNIITKLIMEINKKYFNKNQDSSDDEDDVALIHYRQIDSALETEGTRMSLKEQLQKRIDETVSAAPSTSSADLSDREELETSIRMQMAIFDRGGPRQVHLSQAYDFLLSIPPTSVECERVFSSTKYICNYLRSALKDDSMDALSFLRSHYQRIAKNAKNASSLNI